MVTSLPLLLHSSCGWSLELGAGQLKPLEPQTIVTYYIHFRSGYIRHLGDLCSAVVAYLPKNMSQLKIYRLVYIVLLYSNLTAIIQSKFKIFIKTVFSLAIRVSKHPRTHHYISFSLLFSLQKIKLKAYQTFMKPSLSFFFCFYFNLMIFLKFFFFGFILVKDTNFWVRNWTSDKLVCCVALLSISEICIAK